MTLPSGVTRTPEQPRFQGRPQRPCVLGRARPAPSPPLHAPVSSLLLSQSQKAPCPQPRGLCVCCAPAGGGLPSPRALYPGFSASQGCPNCDHDAAGSKRQRFIISSLDSSLKSRSGKAVLSAEAPGACPSRLFQLLGVPGAPRAGAHPSSLCLAFPSSPLPDFPPLGRPVIRWRAPSKPV